jgi:hypothetical protein
MSDILGYFGNKEGIPIAYMRKSGIILFSNKKELTNYKYLGNFNILNNTISNRYIRTKHKEHKQHKQQQQKGAGGFFGESQGSCGWGNNPSCCFSECAPLWRTTLWPFSNATM